MVEKSQFFFGGKRRRKLLGDGWKDLILLGEKREEIMVEKSQFFLGKKQKDDAIGFWG
jgi:hypothetical protein